MVYIRNFKENNIYHKLEEYFPFLLFIAVVSILYITNAFPALYGDEYSSLTESQHLLVNLHSIGYFIQLNLWQHISGQDWFLRLLSIIWTGIGIYWFRCWLDSENLDVRTVKLATTLAIMNPFLWVYGFQIRYYAYFFAVSMLFVWRFREWQKSKSGRNSILLAVSLPLLLTAHLFGTLVLGTMVFLWLWSIAGEKRWFLLGMLVLVLFMILLPFIRSPLVSLVYRFSNPYAESPAIAPLRGLHPAMFAKIPLTLYFFTLGERFYPLWWWFTLPAMLMIGVIFMVGFYKAHNNQRFLILFMLLNIPTMFLVLDPLAPPGLQGAAPRYVIYVLPFYILLISIGAQIKKWMPTALLIISFAGLMSLVFSNWSYGRTDLVDWPGLFNNTVKNPSQTCVVNDGRSNGSVMRYLPDGVKISKEIDGCFDYPSILLVTNDFRLHQVEQFDQFAKQIGQDYILETNISQFPAQISVYYETPLGNIGKILPSRLDIPEQDLRFPIQIQNRGWDIYGFTRLDQENQSIEIQLDTLPDKIWFLTNYYTDDSVPDGAPVFSIDLVSNNGNIETWVAEAGITTSSWSGDCSDCVAIYEWNKRVHLVGSGYGYPGAYRTYKSRVWGAEFDPEYTNYRSLTVTYLLQNGKGYFWGLFEE